MKHCDKFCRGSKNTDKGMIADHLDIGIGGGIKLKIINDGYGCPFGFTHNPKTKAATENIIKNGGRQSLCHNNPWKYA